MPIDYGFLKGRPVSRQWATDKSKHYQILVSADGILARIAVNAQSADGSEIEFLLRSPFEHPITAKLMEYGAGPHPIKSEPGGIALDYVRGNLAQPQEFTPLPLSAAGPDNDLNEKLDRYVLRSIADPESEIYAFGADWGPEWKPDAYFGFRPGRGVHDIHMNQGNPRGQFGDDNGPWQDGGLLMHFPKENQWMALLIKFQTQAWHTDDRTGNPV